MECHVLCGIDVGADGSRGGLSLGWREEHLHSLKWKWIDFYGSPYNRNREGTWNKLKNLSRFCTLPWLVSGDFNEILFSHKKKGIPRDDRIIE
ncbi:endonuclease/exonuclease/phosphatase family protein [Gossypium australe]|uniref:Endonuclease/exonuclease/phosphatase family protein n=1 Tax=Gossypium australe TaxID=47621 RepID=A0A5B6VYT7_9ROSI|nr:endonuclease/exonuclease/phosphatase family protein [Gossypium australe]